MVTVTDPSSVTTGAGAASQGWNRSGSSSSGAEVHSQQRNRALLSSSHGLGRVQVRLAGCAFRGEGGRCWRPVAVNLGPNPCS